MVRTVDTDVLILLISHISQVELGDDVNIHAYLINSDEYKDIKTVIRMLGPDICRALPFFYAFSGSDIVSSFFGKGKCKMFDVWLQSIYKDELTTIFIQFRDSPAQITQNQMN